jgi:1-phosphatidylinositol phosphodiesterase
MYQLRTVIIVAILQYAISQALYNHGTSSNVNGSWMGLLDNGIPIRQMSIIGSHSSMSQGIWGDAFQTQGNSLMKQMVMGMRALDIRCNHKNNAFPINDRMIYLNIDLGGVLTIVRSFLQANST